MWLGSHDAASFSFMRCDPNEPSLRAYTKSGGACRAQPSTADSAGSR